MTIVKVSSSSLLSTTSISSSSLFLPVYILPPISYLEIFIYILRMLQFFTYHFCSFCGIIFHSTDVAMDDTLTLILLLLSFSYSYLSSSSSYTPYSLMIKLCMFPEKTQHFHDSVKRFSLFVGAVD